MVTMHRFLSDGVARKADRQSDPRDKAFDHGTMLPVVGGRKTHITRGVFPLRPHSVNGAPTLETLPAAIELIVDADWPPQAISMRALVADGRQVHSAVKRRVGCETSSSIP